MDHRSSPPAGRGTCCQPHDRTGTGTGTGLATISPSPARPRAGRRPLLLTLILVAAAQPAWALQVTDGGVTANISVDLQTRGEIAHAADGSGATFDAVRGQTGSSDQADLSIHRARLFVWGTIQDSWRYDLSLRADNADTSGYGDANRSESLYKAYLEYRLIDADAAQDLHAGLDYPFFNRGLQADPYYLLPEARATTYLVPVRGVGGRYKLTTPQVAWGVDVMESLAGGLPSATPDPSSKPAANAAYRNGLFASTRIEVAALGDGLPAYREDYGGAPGTSLLLAAEAGYDDGDYQYVDTRTNTFVYGAEALLHADSLSALAEIRFGSVASHDLPTGQESVARAAIVLVQAGYAVPFLGSTLIEPALRYTHIRLDSGFPGQSGNYDGTLTGNGFGSPDAEAGTSGDQVDAGLNWFLLGDAIKLQLSYERWRASSGAAVANIWRLQEQYYF